MADSTELYLPKFLSFTKTYHHKPYPFISLDRPGLSAAGKNVVVTGGGTGIGKAIAIAFAEAGASSVAILGRRKELLESSAAAITAAGKGKTKVLYEVADLTNSEDVNNAFQSIVSKTGKISILVSNAGVLPTPGVIATTDFDLVRQGFAVNVIAAFHVLRAFLPLASPDAVILNISSNAATIDPVPGLSAYAVSKAANLKMMDYFGAENPGIHVVNIQPGVVATDMSRGLVEGQDEPELSGQFCVWLASPEARFLKNKFVWANWDAEELVSRKDEISGSRLLRWGLEGLPM